MIFYMHSKDLIKHWIVDDPVLAVCSQYVIVSNQVYTRNSCKDIVSNKSLYPQASFLSEYVLDKDWEMFKQGYQSQLTAEHIVAFLALVLEVAIKDNQTVVFLCSKEEYDRCPFFDILSDFCDEMFGYPLIDYSFFKKHPYSYHYNEKKTLKVASEIREGINRSHTPSDKSPKKVIKKFLSAHGIEYDDDMSKQELLNLIPRPKVMRFIDDELY